MKYLVHADGAIPNLALMTLARHFRDRGEPVRLVRSAKTLWDEPGECYGSSIFTFSEPRRKTLESSWGAIRWGGTGVDLRSNLADIEPSEDWDSLRPDYSIYPDYRFSLGFTQRGCRMRCQFCVVPAKEGKPRSVKTIHQIWRGEPWPKKLVLLDNDFFGQPESEWKARIHEIKEGRFKVSFCQGINIRQITEEAALALAPVEYRDNEFRERVLYTAWDNLGDERVFKRGVEILRVAGIPPTHLRVYMLTGYRPSETMDEILYRFGELVRVGCQPFPMVYDPKRKDLKAFQRWAVTGLYRAVPWNEYRDPRLTA